MSERLIFTEKLKEERKFWRKRLSVELGECGLPLSKERGNVYRARWKTIDFTVPERLHRRLEEVTKGSLFLTYVTLMAALKICLYKYTWSNPVVIGSPAAEEGASPENSNAVAIVDDVDDEASFRDLLLRVRGTLADAYSNQSYPIESVIRDLGLEGIQNRCPLFNVVLRLEGLHGDVSLRNDITLSFKRNETDLSGVVSYHAGLFSRDRINGFVQHFLRLLRRALENSTVRIRNLSILSRDEKERLANWGYASQDFPEDRCVHQLFEAQVERTPDKSAVIFEDEGLSYRELDERANQAARYLRKLGAGPDSVVALCLDRGLDMVSAVVGVLKAGGAYLPLNVTYPAERLAYILQDAGAKVLWTQASRLDQFQGFRGKIVTYQADGHDIKDMSKDAPDYPTDPDNLAYVLYTSGSTGTPKGVSMSHRSLCNLTVWQASRSATTGRTLQYASLTFDVSFQELFSTWNSGGTVVLISNETQSDPSAILRTVEKAKVSRLFLPFVALQQLAKETQDKPAPEGVREINTAGEQLRVTPALVNLFRQTPECQLHNQYGPTESHVVSAFTLTGPPSRWPPLPPIGRPIPNTRLLLLDGNMQLVPVGASGEVYIGGVPLARGYHNAPRLTAERFMPDPFNAYPGARLYKTGDLARHGEDGNLEFIGRLDHQVKVRGFRVELGEIEVVVGLHPAVQEVAVVASEDSSGDKRLIAYVIPRDGRKPSISDLRQFLKLKLPEHMIPSAFVLLDEFPLTSSGKVDRRKLPAPDAGRPDLKEAFEAPRNPVEEKLAGIWQESLHLERIGVHDDFFDLGGNSLLATQMISRIRDAFEVDMPQRQIFEASTLAELAVAIVQNQIQSQDSELVERALAKLGQRIERKAT